ncbi:MAG TPA: hypothetical protein VKU00_23125, partial [Chthonomonadaceae bacterium]|nr:hypothetical protein [Chthonomonadaceae bacterium]
MHHRPFLAILSIVILLTLAGCGSGSQKSAGTNTGTNAGSFALTDSSGYPVSGSRALASNHGISATVNGLGAYDQAAFLFTGPTGATEQPPHGLPACSYFSIYTVDKSGNLPSQLISPKLPAGNYTLKIYDLKGAGPNRTLHLQTSFNLTVADNPANVPAVAVGSVSGATFTANDSFIPGNDLYVQGSGFPPGQTVDVYVTAHKDAWSMNDSLIDVSGTVANAPPNIPAGSRASRRSATGAKTRALQGSAKTVTADANGRFGPLLAWQAIGAEADQSTFDVIVDA